MKALQVLHVAIVFGSLSLLVGAEKNLSWQPGKVLDSEASEKFLGAVGGSTTSGGVNSAPGYATYGSHTTNTTTAVYRRYETFVIESDTHVYVARQELKWKWSKPANLTVNGPVKFAVKSRKLWVIDDDGKQHELDVVKQVLKSPSQSSK